MSLVQDSRMQDCVDIASYIVSYNACNIYIYYIILTYLCRIMSYYMMGWKLFTASTVLYSTLQTEDILHAPEHKIHAPEDRIHAPDWMGAPGLPWRDKCTPFWFHLAHVPASLLYFLSFKMRSRFFVGWGSAWPRLWASLPPDADFDRLWPRFRRGPETLNP